MSINYVDQVTLDCLLNRELINQHLNNKMNKSINKKDKKFYRKRIFDLTKILLLNKEKPNNLFPDIKYAFDNYLKACINYFKTIDNNDIIQDEYKDLEYIINDNLDNEIDNIDNSISNLTQEEADKLMMRTINIKPTLDKFVKKVSTKKDEIILPKQKEINLDNPNLKTKGIKKKNINNKYDEKSNKKEETLQNKEDIEKYKN